MKLPFSLFLAFKYLKPKRSLVSVITVLTMLGITLGVGVLIVVLAVMTGFDDTHKEYMLKLDSHLKVYAPGGYSFDSAPVLDCLKEIPEVTAAAPAIEGFVLMQGERQSVVGMMRGVDPDREAAIIDVEKYLEAGSFDLEDETVVVGNILARKLGVHLGDKLTILSPQCWVSVEEIRLPQEVTVSGIFSVGMYDVDSQFMISSLGMAREVFNLEGGVEAVRVITKDPFKIDQINRKVQNALQTAGATSGKSRWLGRLRTQTWVEKNQVMLSTLKTEKDMMFLLLCLISLVATMSITNTLITICVQKTNEIGLLKSLGFSSHSVVNTFILLGSVQGIFGCLFGVVFGVVVSNHLDAILNFFRRFNPGLMPVELYQFNEMPSRVSFPDVLSVCAIVMVFSTLAGALPAWRAAKMEPVDALRYE